MSNFMGLNLMDQMNFLNWKIYLYNDVVIFIESIIAFMVFSFMISMSLNKSWTQSMGHWFALELIWTISPVLILLFLGLPSLKMLYFSEIYNFSSYLSLKVMGHQWYWEYSFPEFNTNILSFPKVLSELIRFGESILLVLPFNFKIRAIISSSDVIHSWALPSMSFKMDAIPGRLNFYMMMFMMPGKFIGQCSELCGTYHSWMPIYIETTSISLFFEWMKSI
uniref:Cytochrome c oxidase subunit 2 n=1 Tax=Romanomermis culicivorax TaxID=13658 RepID=A1EHF0_ROMCU|nr:cytochrome c oxidase subunit II [Romanomermis culicivorax]ABL11579.1 cytochrome c oxidase subunit II [Romanomermis culicivorax]